MLTASAALRAAVVTVGTGQQSFVYTINAACMVAGGGQFGGAAVLDGHQPAPASFKELLLPNRFIKNKLLAGDRSALLSEQHGVGAAAEEREARK